MGPPWVWTLSAALVAVLFGALWARRRRRVRALERQVARLNDDLDRVSEARETFFDLVTHELRSPLTAILGYQELLADGAYGDVAEPVAEPIDRIGRSARHLLHLIDGVVELSRIRTGTIRPDIAAFDLGVLLSSVADSFRLAARERGVEPRVELPDSLPTVHSDRARLVRALDLFVTSAVKHPAGPTITLRVSRHDDGDVTVHIAETEIGIREDVDDLALRLGIRVAVADGIARVLGGSLDLRSDPDSQDTIRAVTFRIHSVDPASRGGFDGSGPER